MAESQTSLTILGIDPGSRVTGFGIIKTQGNKHYYVASGCIRCETQGKLVTRLKQIFSDMREVVSQYQPDAVAIEEVFMHKNAGGALKLGQARGAAIAAVASVDVDLSIAEYSPRQIKQAVVGHGGAEKEQVQHMICKLLQLKTTPQQDAADALAVAICHSHMYKGLQRLAGAEKMSHGRLR